MARNPEKDRQAEAQRKQQILEVGFKLFSEQGIEAVSMNAVAAAAGVCSTTLFNYYQTKEKLVVSISGMVWSKVWQEELNSVGPEAYAQMSAYEMNRHYTECIIRIYQEQPDLLRFSSDYKTFICRQHAKLEDLKEHLDPLHPIQEHFHHAYLRAQTDHSIRTDISEEVLFTAIAVSMLATAERYAQGIVWADRGVEDHTQELRIAQDALLSWLKD